MPSISSWPKRTSAALLSALAVTTSCTGDSDVSRSEPSPAVAPAHPEADARPLLFGVIGSPPTLDPYAPHASDLTYALARPVYPSLLRLLPRGTPKLDLARDVDPRAGAAVVRLKPARWSDGSAITARDVVASAGRAAFPSGFAGLEASVVDRLTVRFEGPVRDWERRLARLTFVLPAGRAGDAYGGPYSVSRYVEGYELALRRNPRYFGRRAESPRLNVRFVQDLDLLLLLLERGRLDAAAPPATVNLDQRLEAHGLGFQSRIGWEAMWLDFSRSDLAPQERTALTADVRWANLERSFVREAGRLEPGLGASDDLPVYVKETMIGPNGDELLSLVMRAAWFQLRDEGHSIELLRVDPDILYGPWADGGPRGLALRRVTAAPGLDDPLAAGEDARRVFELATFVTWRDGVEGVAPNPTLDGPLWNAETIEKH